jgi:3-oxoacyl-[acyl-carrier protein] reductase
MKTTPKYVLVTGAASGIGSAFGKLCVEQGHNIYGLDVSVTGDEPFPIEKCDVTDPDGVRTAVEQIVDRCGQLDSLVCCAGIINMLHLDDMTIDEYNRVMSVNLLGTMLVCQQVYPKLRETGGSIVLLSSIAAQTGGVRSGPIYAASKGGVVSFARWLAQDGASHGVRTNVVCPGPVDTPMIQGQGYQDTSAIPLGRLGTPEDIALSIEYLVSDKSDWITGQVFGVNGGLHLN